MKIFEIIESASAGGTSSGSVASSTGGGNGFLNGGPGTLTRAGTIPKKKKTNKKNDKYSKHPGE